MKIQINNYLDLRLEEKGINKRKLYNDIICNFYQNESDYVSYKGFLAKFYNNKFTVEDIFYISYLLDLDLNYMKNILMGVGCSKNKFIVKKALSKSIYTNLTEKGFSDWVYLDDEGVYIIWFKDIFDCNFSFFIEFYDIKKEISEDCTYITSKAILEIDKDWKNKNIDRKIETLKTLNLNILNNK